MGDARRLLGGGGEELAARALAARGHAVLARNVRTRYGEIDLVCTDGRGYLFVEVKTRRTSSFVSAREAMDARKRARIERLAETWLAAHGRRDAPWRVVLAALTVSAAGTAVEIVPVE